jgi:hypothetical protein
VDGHGSFVSSIMVEWHGGQAWVSISSVMGVGYRLC